MTFAAVAAEGAPRAIAPPSSRDLHRWVSGLDGREHVALLTRVARGDAAVSAEILRRFRQQAPPQAAALPLRTAGELRVKAEAIARKRLDAVRQREARERARREREERASRERFLTGLARRERQAWERVDGLIGTKRPGDYAAAVTLLVDLRDMSGLNRRDAAFAQRLATIRSRHAKKPRRWLASQRPVCKLPSASSPVVQDLCGIRTRPILANPLKSWRLRRMTTTSRNDARTARRKSNAASRCCRGTWECWIDLAGFRDSNSSLVQRGGPGTASRSTGEVRACRALIHRFASAPLTGCSPTCG